MYFYKRHTVKTIKPLDKGFVENGLHDTFWEQTKSWLGGLIRQKRTYERKIDGKIIEDKDKGVGFSKNG